MGDTFSFDSDRFTAQAPVFHSAGSELAAALERLKSAIAAEGTCWGNDEPGRRFAETYEPDASKMVQNVDSLARMLQQTGSSVQKTAEQIGANDLDLGRYVGKSGTTGDVSPMDRTSNPARSIGASTGTTAQPTTDGYPTTGGYRGAASNSSESAQPTSASSPATTNSANGSYPSGPGASNQPGVQPDSSTPDAGDVPDAGRQPDEQSGDPSSPTATSSSATTPDAATSSGPLPDVSAAEADYSGAAMNAPVTAGGADTTSGRSPASARPSSPGSSQTSPRNPWSSGPARRPVNKRKDDKKPRKRPSGAVAPSDADRPPGTGPDALQEPASDHASDPRPDATPWSRPDASEPPTARSPRKDAIHGATESG